MLLSSLRASRPSARAGAGGALRAGTTKPAARAQVRRALSRQGVPRGVQLPARLAAASPDGRAGETAAAGLPQLLVAPLCAALLVVDPAHAAAAAAAPETMSVSEATGLVTTGVALATAFFGGVAYLTDKSMEGLKTEVKSVKADVKRLDKKLDRTSTLTTVVSVLTLATVVYMAVAAPAPIG